MIITFCGHSDFSQAEKYEQVILGFLEETVGDSPADMYLGGYGGFDSFAYSCCKKYKQDHPQISLIFVTPYMSAQYQKSRIDRHSDGYDAVIYPQIEERPLKFAITYRNRYMVESADYIVAYVSHDWGGAYATYKYAKAKGKKIFNLANSNIQKTELG